MLQCLTKRRKHDQTFASRIAMTDQKREDRIKRKHWQTLLLEVQYRSKDWMDRAAAGVVGNKDQF